ncbi:MAG: NAD(P)/FAD-dependent oxidoreductase [Lachnospiraceae bacterium]|nr:NAD(P)/FAD-dependent oxidoreductase [Lachnospiraceae bacterium]
MIDVAIIGAGVVGCAIARELSRYSLDICVIEKSEDVCCGTSKANSAIIHAGYDAAPGTKKASFNVIGNSMMDRISKELDFHFRRNGSLVVMFEGDDRSKLEELYERGIKNGVEGLRIIEKDELRKMEPNIADDAVAALYAPSAGIVCPFSMTIAYAENAFDNGVCLIFNTCVTGIEKKNGLYEISCKERGNNKSAGTAGTDNGFPITAKAVINAAGVYADTIHNMVSAEKYEIKARRGCYFLLDKSAGDFVKHTVFTLPNPMGKGILTAPTVHHNLIVGPDALDTDDRESTCTTAEELDKVRANVTRNLKNPPMKAVITSFAGLRAHEKHGDFIIGECEDSEFFFDCVGIESPGLSAAPAIGVHMAELVAKRLGVGQKADFDPIRKGIVEASGLSAEERNRLIASNPAYGNIICRCEGISEGEIIDSIRRSLGATTLDGVKRRVRAGMGRCQAGFCSPRTMEIIARELNIPLKSVKKSGADSFMIPNQDINVKYRQKD